MIRTLLRLAAVSVVLCASRGARAEQPWALQLTAEAGVGLRNVDVPRDGIVYQVRTGLHPALGVKFALEHGLSARLGVGLIVHYQTSVGLVLREQLTGGVEHARKTRSQRAEAALALRWELGLSGWALDAALGYGILELDPENHLTVPSYHLAGPFARVGVRIPLGTERFVLSVAPEAQLNLQIGDELAAARAFSVGGSAAFELSLSERWLVALSYRELRSYVARFEDTLRFATAHLRGQL